MAFTEDLDLFLADFGVTATAGSITGLGIFDMPTEIIADGVILTTDYRLTAKASEFGDLLHGSQINVNGSAYTVRNSQFVDDGQFVEIMLQRSLETPYQVSATPIEGNSANLVIDTASVVQLDPEIDGGGASTTYTYSNDSDGGAA